MTDAKCLAADQGTGGKVVRYGNRQTNPNTYVVGVTKNGMETHNLELGDGDR